MKLNAIQEGLEKLFELNSINHDKLCLLIKEGADDLYSSHSTLFDHTESVEQIYVNTKLLKQINARWKYIIDMLKIVRYLRFPKAHPELDYTAKRSENNFIRMKYSKDANSIELEEINTELDITIKHKMEEKTND
jgi:hypothetical protein